ncbi:hypothetical protein D3C83_232240 [compost metagenome]
MRFQADFAGKLGGHGCATRADVIDVPPRKPQPQAGGDRKRGEKDEAEEGHSVIK